MLSLLQASENRDTILVGAIADFCNRNGQVVVRNVLKGLELSEKVVKNRCEKLKIRL